MKTRLLFHSLTLSFCLIPLAGCESLQFGMKDISRKMSTMRMPAWFGGGEQAPQAAPIVEKALVAGQCPKITAVPDLSEIHQFTEADAKGGTDLISVFKLTDVKSKCMIHGADAVIDLDMTFEGRTGPKARMAPGDKPRFSYPYFMAIMDPHKTIISKEVFGASISYGPKQNELRHVERMRQIIPGGAKVPADTYSVLIGFQLTDEELSYNRAHMASKGPVEDIGMLGPYPSVAVEKDVLFDPEAAPAPAGAQAPSPVQ